MSQPTRRRRTPYQQVNDQSLVEQSNQLQHDPDYDNANEYHEHQRTYQQSQRNRQYEEDDYNYQERGFQQQYPYPQQAAPPINVIVNNTNTNNIGAGMAGSVSTFDGKLLQLIAWSMLGALITVCTLGICYPWALCMLYGWKINHTVIDGRRLHFSGSAIGLFGNWIKWLLLTLITVGIYGFWLGIKLEQWRVKNTHYI